MEGGNTMRASKTIKLRGNWGNIKPVTKVVPNKKKYNRKRDKKAFE
jgi:hypothetical protein